MNAQKDDEVTLIYDGECPVCSAYSAGVDVQAGAGAVRRVDARSSDALVAQATAAGLDLDEGMVVVHRGQLHHGAEALHLMATLAPAKGFKNRLNRWLFGSLAVSRVLYPLLRAGRNALLWLLGKSKIRNLDTASRKGGA
ncbi:MAG: DCC1-like thiol-disulfide oxidoreductase family protein [Pseudomonadota bacterium]